MLFDDYIYLNHPNESSLLSAKEGFLRGNLFKDEYIPYKGLTYAQIEPKSEMEAMLLNVMQYEFAINDLNLYLDLNPDDKKALEVLNELIKEGEKAKEEYITSFGPLDICNATDKDKFTWINNPWPWEGKGGSMYV